MVPERSPLSLHVHGAACGFLAATEANMHMKKSHSGYGSSHIAQSTYRHHNCPGYRYVGVGGLSIPLHNLSIGALVVTKEADFATSSAVSRPFLLKASLDKPASFAGDCCCALKDVHGK